MTPTNGFAEHLRETTGSAHTQAAYVRDAAEFEAFLAGQPVSVQSLRAWVRSLNHGTHKPQSISRKLSAVRRWLAWRRVELGDVAAAEVLSILRDFKVSPAIRQVDREEVRPVEPPEFSRVLPHLHGEARSLAEFLWHSGARISEALGDPLAGIPPLTVEDGMRLVRDGWTQQSGKGGKRRVLILSPAGRRVLGEDLDSGRLHKADSGANGEALLWSISRSSMNRALHRASDMAGVARFGCHAFRHSFKARLRRAGVDAELIRRLLGHSAASVTEGYGRAGVDELLQAVGVLR